MSGKIARLPEFVANQIAAGEVVLRPASVVKELMENAIDAGAGSLIVSIKEGGRELIQVIDDGSGMAYDDALTAFERHATSKIAKFEDLFALQTFGFRGEALPSIASVAEVELKTRQEEQEIGTRVVINGGELVEHCEVGCPKGTQFAIKNLFYNVPARRKFLKKDNIEANHVEEEFCRVALCNPKVAMFFYKNDECKHNLPAANLRQRIANLTKKNMNNFLIDVFVETSIVKLHGFVGKPEAAKKSPEQYFFVNGRYFKSYSFQKAVMQAYQKLLPNKDVAVPFFLYFTIDPQKIDVNISPSKTEVKFEDEQAIWQIILAAVRESLGKYGVVPMIDFDTRDQIEIPVLKADTQYKTPEIEVNPNFNPFDDDFSFTRAVYGAGSSETRESSHYATTGQAYNPNREYDNRSEASVEYDSCEHHATNGYNPDRYGTDTYHPENSSSGAAAQSDPAEKWNSDFESEFYSTINPDSDPQAGMVSDSFSSMEIENYRMRPQEGVPFSAIQGISFESDSRPLLPEMERGAGFSLEGLGGITFEEIAAEATQSEMEMGQNAHIGGCFPVNNRYIAASINGTTCFVDSQRAAFRVAYERFLNQMEGNAVVTQQEMFPLAVALSPSDFDKVMEHRQALSLLGFDVSAATEKGCVLLQGVPAWSSKASPQELFEELVEALKQEALEAFANNAKEQIAISMASIYRTGSKAMLSQEKIVALLEELLLCSDSNYTPDGKRIYTVVTATDIATLIK